MYKIVDTRKKVDVKTGFDTREDAKPKRDELNGSTVANMVKDAKRRFVISRDASHPRGETDGFDHTAAKRWL